MFEINLKGRILKPIQQDSLDKIKIMPLIALCVGFFLVMMDVTVINVVVPKIGKYINADLFQMQWIVDSYTLSFACLLLTSGYLADRFGSRSIFILGLFVFVLFSFFCGIIREPFELIIFRSLQGIGAALVVPTSLSLINAIHSDKKLRARAIGIWGAVAGIAAALGPVLGAFLTSFLSWRTVFFINIPIGILGVLFTFKFVPDFLRKPRGSFDLFGQLMGILCIALLAYSLIEIGKFGWFSETVIISFLLFLVTFIIFLTIEILSFSPMFPLNFFKSSAFSIPVLIGMVLNIGFYGTLFILPLYFQELRGYSVLMTGLAVLPLVGLGGLGAYLGGKISALYGPKLTMQLGLILGGVGFFILLIVQKNTPEYYLLLFPMMCISFGSAFTMPAATVATIHAVPEGNSGLASGTLNASRQIGSLIGVAIFGSVISVSQEFISGVHITLVIAGSLFLLGSLVVFSMLKK